MDHHLAKIDSLLTNMQRLTEEALALLLRMQERIEAENTLFQRRKRKALQRDRSDVQICCRRASSDQSIRGSLVRIQNHRCAGLVIDGEYHPCQTRIDSRSGRCDHIIELQFLGCDEKKNLQMLCTSCDSRKTRLNCGRRNARLVRERIRSNPLYRHSQRAR